MVGTNIVVCMHSCTINYTLININNKGIRVSGDNYTVSMLQFAHVSKVGPTYAACLHTALFGHMSVTCKLHAVPDQS